MLRIKFENQGGDVRSGGCAASILERNRETMSKKAQGFKSRWGLAIDYNWRRFGHLYCIQFAGGGWRSEEKGMGVQSEDVLAHL